jgi:hypothetical protein
MLAALDADLSLLSLPSPTIVTEVSEPSSGSTNR